MSAMGRPTMPRYAVDFVVTVYVSAKDYEQADERATHLETILRNRVAPIVRGARIGNAELEVLARSSDEVFEL